MNRVLKKIKAGYEIILSAIFPCHCVTCKSRGTYLCEECDNKISKRSNYDNPTIFCITTYHHPAIRQLIWLLKYRGVRDVAEIFARWLYEALLEDLAETAIYREQAGKILIIPIPLSKKRLRERGFNQAEEIARYLCRLEPNLFRLVPDILIRIKNTPTQVSVKKRTDRLKNLIGAFGLTNKKTLRGRTIILVDDVTTTGATLMEAEKALKRGKPRRVIKVAIAGG